MTVRLGDYSFSGGHASAQANVPTARNAIRQATSTETAEQQSSQAGDTVTLSSRTNRAAVTEIPRQTLAAWRARSMTRNENSTAGDKQVVREERICAVMSVLSTMGYTGEENIPPTWPGGLSAPSSEELAIAGRRLALRARLRQEA